MLRITTYVKWREINNFPNHFISNTGLFRYKKTIRKPRLRTGRIDYLFIVASSKETNKWGRYDIHRLVWDYFGSEPHKKGFELHHKDKNPQNNHIDNLQLLPMLEHKALHPKRSRKAA